MESGKAIPPIHKSDAVSLPTRWIRPFAFGGETMNLFHYGLTFEPDLDHLDKYEFLWDLECPPFDDEIYWHWTDDWEYQYGLHGLPELSDTPVWNRCEVSQRLILFWYDYPLFYSDRLQCGCWDGECIYV